MPLSTDKYTQIRDTYTKDYGQLIINIPRFMITLLYINLPVKKVPHTNQVKPGTNQLQTHIKLQRVSFLGQLDLD